MPTYEYSCPKCGIVEVSQKITEDALKSCPNCGSAVERLISGGTFHLKGSGWYKTDYAAKPAPSKDSTAPKTEGAPAETSKSDAPAEKPAAPASSTDTK